MVKTTLYIIKSFLIVLMLTSCIDNSPIRTKYSYIKAESKEWLLNDSMLVNECTMIDNFGIKNNFGAVSQSTGFDEGESGFAFVRVEKSYTERIEQSSYSLYRVKFSYGIRAGSEENLGDMFHFGIDDTRFIYTLKSNEINSFYCNVNNLKWRQTDQSLANLVCIKSEILDSFSVNNTIYKDVIHFKVTDNSGLVPTSTATEVYYAKGVGFVKYTLKSGVFFERE